MRNKTIRARGFALVLASFCSEIAWSAPLPRVASINLCADQLLMDLAQETQIVSLGPFSRDPVLSYRANDAQRFQRNSGSAETALKGNPDLIVVGSFDSAQTRRLLQASGKTLFVLPPWSGFEAGARDIRALAAVIGRPEAGERLVHAIDAARAKAMNTAKPGLRALVLGRGFYADISASLVHDLIKIVGFTNASLEAKGVSQSKAGRFLSLEEVLMLKPDILVLGETSQSGHDRKAQVFAHPAFEKIYPAQAMGGPRRIILPERLTACGGPSLIEALERLSGDLPP